MLDQLSRFSWRNWKLLLLVTAISFVILQISYMSKLTLRSPEGTKVIVKYRQQLAANKHSKLIKDPNGNSISLRGTHNNNIIKYFPNINGMFNCIETREEIDFIKINDNYCDCPTDGSDEPGTNACNKGKFYCEKSLNNFPDQIPSYRVNDGVCDCCDGSDEWLEVLIPDTSNQNRHHYTKCKNRCL